jgi:hypothetical protein
VSGTDPVTPVFPAGSGPLPADFDAWVQAPFTFLTSKVVFRAQLQGGMSLSAGENIVPYDTILEDPYSGWNSGTSQWTCPAGCSGWYGVTMTAWSNSAGINTDLIESVLYLNGSVYQECSGDWGVNGHATGSSGSVPISLYGGQDAISGSIFSSAAVGVPTTNGQYPSIEVCWLCL